MLVRGRHVLIASATTAVVVAALFFAVLLQRSDGDIKQALQDAEFVALAAGLSALAVAFVCAWAAWRVHSGLKAISSQLVAVRQSPSRASLVSGPLSEEEIESFGPLYDAVEGLCYSYRKAIADRVKQRDALHMMQARLGEGERPEPRNITHRPPGASRNMVARLTPNLRWINATPALLKQLGQPLEEINGRAFCDMVHPMHIAELTEKFQEILETGEGHNIVFRLLVRRQRAGVNGMAATFATERRFVRMDVLARYDEEGQPQHFRCYFEDITERVLAEKKLRRRTEELSRTNEQLLRINHDLERLKESYRDLYHNAPIMFFSLDAQGCFVACNDTMVQVLGYPREDLYNQAYTSLLPPESAEAWERGRPPGDAVARPHALMADGEVEMQWLKRDGTIIDVWIRNIPVIDTKGRFLRSRSAAQDITQRKRLGDELRRRGDELEHANLELRTINKELDDFTSVVSHDLKEPLRTLEAYSNLLAEDFSTQLGPDGFECINHMLMASRRLGKLIDDLLALSRAGRIATKPRVFHLNEALAIVRRDLGDMIQRKKAAVVTEGPLPPIVGDMERIIQLLANLIANGLKYNVHPQPMVVVGEQADARPSRFATIFVRDNGIGIDPKFHQDIFGIFRRLHRKEEFEGTGAGLAICKKIVQAHAGKIWVESLPGQGATFFFTVPRSPQAAAAVVQPAAPVLPAHQPPPGNGISSPSPPANLLLVEDMHDMGVIVQRLARKAGHNLHWVTSAEAAWEHLQDHRPDLVLLDIHLPGMDGIELCRRLRTLPQHTELPIALFSQGADPEDISAGLAAGANFVLSKELLCQPEVWRRRLHEVLNSSREQLVVR
jgi:PAS domain S-box-containing protein